jgi:hypothetical protein
LADGEGYTQGARESLKLKLTSSDKKKKYTSSLIGLMAINTTMTKGP